MLVTLVFEFGLVTLVFIHMFPTIFGMIDQLRIDNLCWNDRGGNLELLGEVMVVLSEPVDVFNTGSACHLRLCFQAPAASAPEPCRRTPSSARSVGISSRRQGTRLH